MTVKDLIAQLQRFDPDLEVRALWDCTPNFDINRVDLYAGYVLLDVDEGSSYERVLDDEERFRRIHARDT